MALSSMMEERKVLDLMDTSESAQLTVVLGHCDLLWRAEPTSEPLLNLAAQVPRIQSCDLLAPQPRGQHAGHLHSWETNGLRWHGGLHPSPLQFRDDPHLLLD